MNINTIGIIGYGRFGRLLHSIMPSLFHADSVRIYSRSKKPDNTVFFSLTDLVKRSKLILISVPISQFETIIKQIADVVENGTVVMDVCSVKKYPSSIMLKYLPKKACIIATHPLFGSEVFKKKSVSRLKIVVNNVRCNISMYRYIRQCLMSDNFEVVEMTPDRHDKLIAKSQVVAQTFRWIAQELGYKYTTVDTPSAKRMFDAFSLIGTNKALYEEMLRFNPYAQKELQRIQHLINSVNPHSL